MISDGYCWLCRLPKGITAVYRPMLKEEAEQLARIQHAAGGDDVILSVLVRRLRECENGEMVVEEVKRLYRDDPAGITGILIGQYSPNSEAPWTPDWELCTARNLKEGVVLELTAPQFARRSCTDCQTWWYRDEDGSIVRDSTGKAMLRPEGTVTLCRTQTGCPKGTPENQRALSPLNKLVLRHFQHCDAIGRFPDDPIVARNAAIIRAAIAEVKLRKHTQVASM